MDSAAAPADAAPASRGGFLASWDATLWLCLRVCLARAAAFVPCVVFVSDLQAILVKAGWMPAPAPDPRGVKELFLLGAVVGSVNLLLPLVWVWPIGRYLDTGDARLRPAALRRFGGINRFFALFFAGVAAWGVLSSFWRPAAGDPPFWAVAALEAFSGYFAAYFTLLTLEPILFKDLAAMLYEDAPASGGERVGPLWSVRTKLFLLVVNLIVIPMILVGASMRLGLNGYLEGFGVAILTAVTAVGYAEMLYRGIARPLTRLNEKMVRVSKGDYDAKTSVWASDEIGELKRHFNEMVDGLAERERLKDTFGRFVSVEIAKRLIESDSLVLGGESIEATVLFSDIRDFTPLSETLSPQELVAFLNDYFSFVTEPIARHHGVVNKFIGDAVMAIFAPHFGSNDHAGDALAAALEMRAKLAEFNASRKAPPVRFGIGIHTGLLVAGNIGTAKRMEYTVIGDTVNAASRIESKTKDFACDLLVSESVFARLGEASRSGVSLERCEGVRVKGKEEPLVLYKVG